MKMIIGLMLISLATTACSQPTDQAPDKEQIAVNEIQSDLNAADAGMKALEKDHISCTATRDYYRDGKDYQYHTTILCDKTLRPTNGPKGENIDHEWTSFSSVYWDGATPEARFLTYCVSKKSC